MYTKMDLEKMLESAKEKKLPIVICGAGLVGEVTLAGLLDKGVAVKCFLDNDPEKQSKKYCGLEVIAPENFALNCKNAVFIIATVQYYQITEQLKQLGYKDFYTGLIVLHNIDINSLKLHSNLRDIRMYVKSYILSCNDHPNEKNVEHRVFAQITEKCSLKCKDCKTLMQYFKSPEEISIEETIAATDKLLFCINRLHVLGIVGGEPFLHGRLHELVNYAVKNDKISNISIFTNGTIIPKDKNLECLKNEKVFVHISDYEVAAQRSEKLCEVLDYEGINFYLMPSKYWTDYGKLTDYKYSEEKLKSIYENCWKTGCTDRIIYRGKLITCVRAGFGAQLGVHPLEKQDFVDLLEEIKAEDLKEKVQGFLRDKVSPPACCKYCLGYDYGMPVIPAAIQTKEPLEIMKG